MSHVCMVTTELRDIAAIKAACAEMGLTFKENQTTYKWWGMHAGDYPLPEGITKEDLGKCSHAIGVPGTTWEIGLNQNPQTGAYRVLFDFYGTQGRPIQAAIGAGAGKLVGMYAKHKALLLAKSRGQIVTQRMVGNKMQLTLMVG